MLRNSCTTLRLLEDKAATEHELLTLGYVPSNISNTKDRA